MKNYPFIQVIVAGCIAAPLAVYISETFTTTQKDYLIASLLGSIIMLAIGEFHKLFGGKYDD